MFKYLQMFRITEEEKRGTTNLINVMTDAGVVPGEIRDAASKAGDGFVTPPSGSRVCREGSTPPRSLWHRAGLTAGAGGAALGQDLALSWATWGQPSFCTEFERLILLCVYTSPKPEKILKTGIIPIEICLPGLTAQCDLFTYIHKTTLQRSLPLLV